MNNHTSTQGGPPMFPAVPAARALALYGVAVLLVTVLGQPAAAMLRPYDPAPAVTLDQHPEATEHNCFIGQNDWPRGMAPQPQCTVEQRTGVLAD